MIYILQGQSVIGIMRELERRKIDFTYWKREMV